MTQDREENLDSLDRALAQMAQDTPDMPDDFHARWTEEIRKQAEPDGTASRKESHRQWRYVMSAAAVFVFLICGTLLTRSNGGMHMQAGSVPDHAALPAETPLPEQETLSVMQDMAVPPETNRPEPRKYANAAGASMKTAETAAEDKNATGMAEDTEISPDEEMAAYGEAREAVNSAAYEDREDLLSVAVTAMPTPEPAVSRTETAAAAEIPAEAEAEREETEEAAEETVAGAGKSADGTEAKPQGKQESEFVSFLKDMGIFTLRTLAVVACGAALAFLAALLYRLYRKNKKGGSH